ncbi:hypothetical protein BgiBS90_001874, partial [Biomphalaria glabrata]
INSSLSYREMKQEKRILSRQERKEIWRETSAILWPINSVSQIWSSGSILFVLSDRFILSDVGKRA